LIINHPDFASPDSLVDANTVRLPEAAFCDKSPLDALSITVAKRLTRTPPQSVETTPPPHSAKQPRDGL
jgi:hypothetical protein